MAERAEIFVHQLQEDLARCSSAIDVMGTLLTESMGTLRFFSCVFTWPFSISGMTSTKGRPPTPKELYTAASNPQPLVVIARDARSVMRRYMRSKHGI